MEIKIRQVPAKTIAGIDELAKKNSQSREAYIRDLLNHHVMYIEVEGLDNQYKNLVQQISKDMLLTIQENTKVLNTFVRLNGGD